MIDFFKRLFGLPRGGSRNGTPPRSLSSAASAESQPLHPAWQARENARPVDGKFKGCFEVVEVDSADLLVGDLFRRRFHTDSFPETPRHFVAIAKLGNGSFVSLGYVHYTYWNGCALCGGLVIDDYNYRLLPKDVRQSIREAGGVAEQLLRTSFAALPDDLTAIFGLVGNPQSEKVCLRVGFVRVDSPYLMAVWRDERLNADEMDVLIRKVESLGLF